MAIWTEEQVAALNARQAAGHLHPYTCGGNRYDDLHVTYQALHGGDWGQLVATADGWVCPVCDYRQEWAHGADVAGEWLKAPFRIGVE